MKKFEVTFPGGEKEERFFTEDSEAADFVKRTGSSARIKEVPVEWVLCRKICYQKEIDPNFQEATMDFFKGDPLKMNALVAKYDLIKTQYPKP